MLLYRITKKRFQNISTSSTSQVFQVCTNKVLGVSSAVINPVNNKILLIRREREPYAGKWCFPGGKIEDHETYLDATVREVKEETGMNIKFPRFHLLKIVYIKDYILFSTLSELSGKEQEIKSNDKSNQVQIYIHGDEKIMCKWFSLNETQNLKDEEYVNGIRDLIPEAFELYKLNNSPSK